MDYTGLGLPGTRYKLDRELTQEERDLQLKPGVALAVEPLPQFSVIQLNSSFLDSVDRYYAWRGLLFFIGAGFGGGAVFFYMAVLRGFANRWHSYSPADQHGSIVVSLVLLAIVLPLAMFAFWIALQESFTYTHFPIRLDRRNRKVHVFRPGRPGQANLEADWDKLFFTLGRCNVGIVPGQNWDIRAHVLSPDGKRVLDTFSFSWFTMSQDNLSRHWEFLRRYMEDGPADAYRRVEFCMPISDRRESLTFSFQRIRANFGEDRILLIALLPVWLVWGISRWLAGLTCRVPRWPGAVESESLIVASDPYVRDASMNSSPVQ